MFTPPMTPARNFISLALEESLSGSRSILSTTELQWDHSCGHQPHLTASLHTGEMWMLGQAHKETQCKETGRGQGDAEEHSRLPPNRPPRFWEHVCGWSHTIWILCDSSPSGLSKLTRNERRWRPQRKFHNHSYGKSNVLIPPAKDRCLPSAYP